MRLYSGDPKAMPSLPWDFQYDEQTKTLEVEYTDGTRVRYLNVPATMAFLLPVHMNSHKVPDFLAARANYRSEPVVGIRSRTSEGGIK